MNSHTNPNSIDLVARKIASEVLSVIAELPSSETRLVKSKVFHEPTDFRLTVRAAVSQDISNASALGFSEMPWETVNFNEFGFAIDANTTIHSGQIPSLDLSIVMSPDSTNLTDDVYIALVRSVRHELDHLLNGHETTAQKKTRELSQNSYEYFLLPNEMQPMVNGLALAARERNVEPSQEFMRYLSPFVEVGFITPDQMNKIMREWIRLCNNNESKVLSYSTFVGEKKKINPTYLTRDAAKMKHEIKKHAKKKDDDASAYTSDPKGGWKADYSASGKRYKTKPSKYTIAYNKKFKGK